MTHRCLRFNESRRHWSWLLPAIWMAGHCFHEQLSSGRWSAHAVRWNHWSSCCAWKLWSPTLWSQLGALGETDLDPWEPRRSSERSCNYSRWFFLGESCTIWPFVLMSFLYQRLLLAISWQYKLIKQNQTNKHHKIFRNMKRWGTRPHQSTFALKNPVVASQAATYAVGDTVNCRQVDVNVGVGISSWRGSAMAAPSSDWWFLIHFGMVQGSTKASFIRVRSILAY